MSQNEHFADVFNYYLFGGKQRIKSSELRPLDPTELGMIRGKGKKEYLQKFRDVLKQCIMKEDDRVSYLILGVENQSEIHYAMPVRNMIYDALNYEKQLRTIAAEHREKKDLRDAEFLSGFGRNDVLKPVITLTIYWGADAWDGPRSLSDLFPELSADILHYISDYRMNLIVPGEIGDFEKFHTELGTALEFIASSRDRSRIMELGQNERYRSVSSETVDLLSACTNTKFPFGKGGADEMRNYINEDGTINLCEGLRQFGEEMRSEGLSEGRSQGIMQGRTAAYFDTGLTPEEIAVRMDTSVDQVKEVLEKQGVLELV
jgi:hypothetical protein